jgi:aminoglycoside phosphotransferase (APT) family kinase protein
VALVTHRDPDALRAGLARWLATRRDATWVQIDSLEHPSIGHSSETVLVEVTWAASDVGARDEAVQAESLVVRMAPPAAGTFFDYDVVVQAAAQRLAREAGVPVAAPLVLETDPSWLGDPFLVMPRLDGHIVGESAAHDPWVKGLAPAQQRRLHANFVDAIVRIHGADRSEPAGAPVPRRDLHAELHYWARYLDWSSGGSPLPALTDALAWCRDHVPGRENAPVLLWGDVRLGNVIFGDDLEVRAVLDWDMTTIGAPEHDVAWLTALEATVAELSGRRVAGFLDRDEVVARYEERSGTELRDLEWYETFALVRSTAIMVRIGYLYRDAGEPSSFLIGDNPVVPLLTGRLRS